MSDGAIQEPWQTEADAKLAAMEMALKVASEENQRLRLALKEIGDWCDGQNLYVTRIARDALAGTEAPAPTAERREIERLTGELKDAEQRQKALSELLGKADGEFARVMEERDAARREIERLRTALQDIVKNSEEYVNPGQWATIAQQVLQPTPAKPC